MSSAAVIDLNWCLLGRSNTVTPDLSGHSKRTPKIDFQYRLSLNAGQKYFLQFSELSSRNKGPSFHNLTLLLMILRYRLF